MDKKELEKYLINNKKKILEVQKETVESFKEYFGDYEVIFETVEEVERKFNDFFQWRNKEWIVPGKGKTPEQLWLEAGNPPIELEKVNLKENFQEGMDEFGLIADPIFGIVIIPFYGFLKEFFEGDYKKVPNYMEFLEEIVIKEKMIPSFIVRNIILKNKEKALKIFKELYKEKEIYKEIEMENLDDIFKILKQHRKDWDDSPQTWQGLIDSEKTGTKKQENKETQKEIPKEFIEEGKRSMKEFDLAWKEFFKDKPNPKNDEEDRKQQEEFHYWYNNVRKQSDTGKTPMQMGRRIMNFEWDEDYGEDKIDFGEEI